MAKKQRQSTKKPARKTAARKSTTRTAAPAPKAAAAAAPVFPRLVHIAKGGDKIPVTVTGAEHLARLKEEHGGSSIIEEGAKS